MEMESRLLVARGWGWGGLGSECLMCMGFPIGMMKMFWNWIEVMVTPYSEYTICH